MGRKMAFREEDLPKLEKFKCKNGRYQTISISRLSTFEQCSWEYMLKYIQKVKSDSNLYGVLGSMIHQILEDYYEGKITYREMVVNYENALQYYQVSSIKFKDDEEEHKKIWHKWTSAIRHFFLTHKPLEGDTVNEEFAYAVLNFNGIEKLVIGYIDNIMLEGNKLIITDWKTSTLYSSAKFKVAKMQLILYALLIHLKTKHPLNLIESRWNFLKYTTVHYRLENGNIKTRHVERQEYVKELKSPIATKLKKFTELSKFDRDMLLAEAIQKNDISILPSVVADAFEFEDCYISTEINEDSINELYEFMGKIVHEIEEGKEEPKKAYQRGEIKSEEFFYCLQICGVRKNCEYFEKHVTEFNKRHKKKEEPIKKTSELEDLMSFIGGDS